MTRTPALVAMSERLAVLDAIRSEPGITRAEICERTGLDDRQVRSYLSKLNGSSEIEPHYYATSGRGAWRQ